MTARVTRSTVSNQRVKLKALRVVKAIKRTRMQTMLELALQELQQQEALRAAQREDQ